MCPKLRCNYFFVALVSLLGFCSANAQTVPSPLQVTKVFGITSASQVQDNRSTTQSCDVFTFQVTAGTGNWGVQLEWSDTAPSGPYWTSFGPAAQVTAATNPPIGIGTGYHKWVRLRTTSGTTSVNLSCEKGFFLPVVSSGSGQFDCPLATPTSTGCLSGPEYVTLTEKQDPTFTIAAPGAAPIPLNQIFTDDCSGVNARYFGADPNAGDNTTALNNSLTYAATSGYGKVCLGPGTFTVNSTINLPSKVSIEGRGRGDCGPQTGYWANTCIAAGPSFPVGGDVVTVGTLGEASNGTFGTRISNLSIDGGGKAAGGIRDQFGEEQSGGEHLLIQSTTGYCIRVDGADEPGTGRTQNEWGYEDVECFRGGSNPNFVGIVARNIQEGYGFRRISVVGGSNYGEAEFHYCATLSGSGYQVNSLHCEGADTAAVLLNPNQANDNGANDIQLTDIVENVGSLGPAVEIAYQPRNTASGISILGAHRYVPAGPCGDIKNDNTGECVISPNYQIGGQFGQQTIVDLGYNNTWHLNNSIYDAGQLGMYGKSSTGGQFLLWNTDNPNAFFGWPFLVMPNGALDLGNGAIDGATDLSFHNRNAKFCLDSTGSNLDSTTLACSGVALQGVMEGNFNFGLFQDFYYSPADNLFHYPGDNSGYAGGLVTINPGGNLQVDPIYGGVGIFSSYGMPNGTRFTPQQFASLLKVIVPGSGGIRLVNGQLQGCNPTTRNTLFFQQDPNNTNDSLLWCGIVNGQYGWQAGGSGGGGGGGGTSGNATSLQGVPVSATAPTPGTVLGYNGSTWGPTSPSAITLQTNGIANQTQAVLNLLGAGGTSLNSDANGNVTISSPTLPVFQTNATNNSTQAKLNLAGAGTVSLAEANGTVTITGAVGSGAIQYTVSTLPAASTQSGKTVLVSDGSNATDCAIGGGLYVVPCKSSGTAWANAPIGSGGGGSTLTLQTNGTANTNQTLLNLAGLNGIAVSNSSGTTFLLNRQTLTVATLPAATTNSGYTYFVNDGASSTDCATGHGAYVVSCKSNGSTWANQQIGAAQPVATASSPGIVQPDNTTITVDSNGRITATGGGGGNSTTLNAATGFGAIGDGTLASFGNSNLAAGSTSYSAAWPTPAPVVGDALVIYFAGTGSAGNYSQGYDIMTTITAVSGNTITWTTPTVNAFSNQTVSFYYGHDNTAALNSWASACSNTPEAKCYIPAGVYLTHGHHVFNGASQIYGDGKAATIIKDIDPAQDVFVLKNALPNKTLIPASWQPGEYVHDLGFSGTGMETTGSLLVVDNSQMTDLNEIMFYGHGGPGLNLYSGERVKMQNMWWSETKRAVVNSEATINESSLSHFDIQSDGCVSDNQGPTTAYYNNNINAVNGVMPSSGTIVENYRSAITLYAVANFQIADGSIKPSLCNGGVMITDAVHTSEISHVYFENAGGNPAFSVIFGGPWIPATLATELTPASTGGDLVDGSWLPDLIGNVADATGNNFYPAAIIPPDYNTGASAATTLSSICPAGSACANGSTPVYQNTVEFVYMKWILHDTVGSGWHVAYNARHLSGSTYSTSAVDWPAGAVFQKQYQQAAAGPIQLRGNNHNLAGSVPNGTTLDCNDEIGHVCGEIAAGIWPGQLNVPGSSHFITQARGIYLDGSGKMGTGGNPADGTLEAPNSAWFFNATPYSYAPFSNNVGSGGTTNTLIPMSVGTGSAQMRRATYPTTSNSGPDVKYQDPVREIEMNGAANPGGFWPSAKMEYPSFGIGSSMNSSALNYLWAYSFNDAYNCGSNNSSPCWSDQWLGSDATTNSGGPGARKRLYSSITGGLNTVERDYLPYQSAITSSTAYGIKKTLNMGDTAPTAALTLNNALSLIGLKTPTAGPTITPTGTTGATTYSYVVVAYEYDGTHSAASPAGSTSSGNVTLSATNYNKVSWGGAFSGYPAYFNVYCTAGCSTLGLINPNPIQGTTTAYNDTTGVGAGGTAPTNNNSGSLVLGKTSIAGSVSSDTALGKLDIFGNYNTLRVLDDGGLVWNPTGTQPACTSANRGEVWTLWPGGSTTDTLQQCQRNGSGTYTWNSVGSGGGGTTPPATNSSLGLAECDGTTTTCTNGIISVIGGGSSGSVNSVSINGGSPVTPNAGNVNLTLPTPTAPSGSGMSITTTGNSLQFSTAAPMDKQPAGTSYSLPAADCTATGGYVVIGAPGTSSTSGSESIGIGQPVTNGMAAGCSVTIINAATSGTLTLQLTNVNYNGGTSWPTIAAGWHVIRLIVLDNGNYAGVAQ